MKKIAYFLIRIIQISLIAALFLLNYLSGKKAGVNHHVIARKIQWEASILSDSNLKLISIAVGILVLAIVLIIISKKLKKSFVNRNLVLLIIMGLTIIISQKMVLFKNLVIAPYITIGAIIIFLTQTILILITIFTKENAD